MLALRLLAYEDEDDDAAESSPVDYNFGEDSPRSLKRPASLAETESQLAQELVVIKETMDKTKGLESKVAYQVQKLVALANNAESKAAERERKRQDASDGGSEDDEAAEDENDPLSFKPNPAGMIASSSTSREQSAKSTSGDDRRNRRSQRGQSADEASESDAAAESDASGRRTGVYRPPRVAAVPYNEGKRSDGRKDRRAPALLSEFANTLTAAPNMESTSGLAVRPVVAGQHTNSTSAKRLAELERMREFEEENMTRLVMTKREAKRREEDEAALSMGFGVGGESRSRSRRQGGFEAELEGVLGDKGYSKSMWDDVGRGLGKRDAALDRSRKRKPESGGSAFGGSSSAKKKGRFEKAVRRRK